jgi:hypothetical protein
MANLIMISWAFELEFFAEDCEVCYCICVRDSICPSDVRRHFEAFAGLVWGTWIVSRGDLIQ